MARAYPLYFDREVPDGERRARWIAAALIVAVHVAALLWILLSPLGKQLVETASRLVVIELGDKPERSVIKPATSSRPANRATQTPAPSVSATHARASAEPPRIVPANDPAGHQDTVSAAAAADGATSASRGAGAGGMRSHFRPPKTLHAWLPPYPEDAFHGNHQGTVDLLVTIDSDGTLVAARVDRSSGNASLDRAALESLDRYTFKAAERDGIAVRADAIVTINWIITQAIVQQFSSPRIERIDPANLTHQRVQTQYGSYLKVLQRERDNDSDDRH